MIGLFNIKLVFTDILIYKEENNFITESRKRINLNVDSYYQPPIDNKKNNTNYIKQNTSITSFTSNNIHLPIFKCY